MKICQARQIGARSLDEIEIDIRNWLSGGDSGIYDPIAPDDPWPVREILVELLEGHGVDCFDVRRVS